MAFIGKQPVFGVEQVQSIEEIIREALPELKPLFTDTSVPDLEADELNCLVQAGLMKRPWSCLFCFHQKLAILKYGKPEDKMGRVMDRIRKAVACIKPLTPEWFVGGFRAKKMNILIGGERLKFMPSIDFELFRMEKKPETPSVKARREEQAAAYRAEQAARIAKYEEERRLEMKRALARQEIEARRIRDEARSKGFTSLTVKEQAKLGAGAYGSYIKLSDEYGVKVLRDYPADSMDTVQIGHEKVIRELNDQRKAHEICGSLVPNAMALVPVEMDGRWYPGLIMEHVEGMPLASWSANQVAHIADFYQRNDRERALNQEGLQKTHDFMYKAGITKADHHEHNVLIDKQGNYRVIDWGFGMHLYDSDAHNKQTTLPILKAG